MKGQKIWCGTSSHRSIGGQASYDVFAAFSFEISLDAGM